MRRGVVEDAEDDEIGEETEGVDCVGDNGVEGPCCDEDEGDVCCKEEEGTLGVSEAEVGTECGVVGDVTPDDVGVNSGGDIVLCRNGLAETDLVSVSKSDS